jgi:hypothetical protein
VTRAMIAVCSLHHQQFVGVGRPNASTMHNDDDATEPSQSRDNCGAQSFRSIPISYGYSQCMPRGVFNQFATSQTPQRTTGRPDDSPFTRPPTCWRAMGAKRPEGKVVRHRPRPRQVVRNLATDFPGYNYLFSSHNPGPPPSPPSIS